MMHQHRVRSQNRQNPDDIDELRSGCQDRGAALHDRGETTQASSSPHEKLHETGPVPASASWSLENGARLAPPSQRQATVRSDRCSGYPRQLLRACR